MKKMPLKYLLVLTLSLSLLFTGCQSSEKTEKVSEALGTSSMPTVASFEYDLSFLARDLDAGYDENISTLITFSESGIEVTGEGAQVESHRVIVTQEGTYILSGTIQDGQVLVNAPETAEIQLVFKGLSIHNEDHSAVYIREADKVIITLASDSENSLTDGQEYIQIDDNNVDGVIFSKADLTINGSGILNIVASYKHGIVSENDLVITGGKFNITAEGQGLAGKNCVKIKDGKFNLITNGDAVRSDNGEDSTRGFIYVDGGVFKIKTQGDAFQAETLLQVDAGTFNLKTGGGSANASTDALGRVNSDWGKWGAPKGRADSTAEENTTKSAKALKAGQELILNEGSFTIDSSDDALHSNGTLVINGGTYGISSGDDGLHADSDLVIAGGILVIDKSYEGIEGNTVTITGGIIEVTASDDGINVAGGNNQFAFDRPGANRFIESEISEPYLRIKGGDIKINAYGDGLDSNGNLFIEGGTITVSGPVNSSNGILNYGEGGIATITGGVFMSTGGSGMAKGFSDQSTQYSLLYNLSSVVPAGSEVSLTDFTGKVVLQWTAAKEFSSVQLSAPELTEGTYTLKAGDMVETVTLSP